MPHKHMGLFDYSSKKPIKSGSYGILSCFSLYPGKILERMEMLA